MSKQYSWCEADVAYLIGLVPPAFEALKRAKQAEGEESPWTQEIRDFIRHLRILKELVEAYQESLTQLLAGREGVLERLHAKGDTSLSHNEVSTLLYQWGLAPEDFTSFKDGGLQALIKRSALRTTLCKIKDSLCTQAPLAPN